MSQSLLQVREKFEEKYKHISNAIPVEVVRRCEALVAQIKETYDIFKMNPETITEYIVFVSNYADYKKKMAELEKKIEGVLEL
jgi:hypothetical protein